jgi:hypothetical protein
MFLCYTVLLLILQLFTVACITPLSIEHVASLRLEMKCCVLGQNFNLTPPTKLYIPYNRFCEP